MSEAAPPAVPGVPTPPALPRRFVFCATPAQGHAAPLLALARRLVGEGHAVVFFTTAHYRDKVEATGASFVPFAAEYDAHDLMVANPERESSSKRGVRGVKEDLRKIFVGPIPGQSRGLRGILDGFAADCVVVDTMFFGALPLALAPRAGAPGAGLHRGHALRVVQPRHGAVRRGPPAGERAAAPGAQRRHELGDRAHHAGRHPAPGPAAAGRGRSAPLPRLPHRPATQGRRRLSPGDRGRLRVPAARTWRPRCASSGPILAPPSVSFDAARVVGRARSRAARWCTSPRARSTTRTWAGCCSSTAQALAHDDVLVVATTGGPDPGPLRHGLPANARLERFIPHDLLLPHTDVMVTNGGYGGVQQALAHGVPLVVAGDSEDKPEVAARVQWSGAGINLRTGRPSAAMVARAVRRVLSRASYRRRARALAAEIAASDPLGDITTVLAGLCARRETLAAPPNRRPEPA